jgi:hypothetical protein
MNLDIGVQAAHLGRLLRPIRNEKAALEYVFNFVMNNIRQYRIVQKDPRSRSTSRFQQENTGNQWKHGSCIPVGKSPEFFRRLPTSFPFFPAENARKSPEKIQKFSG